jgi:nucleoside-diphosphate-sugar epimerase
MNNDIFSANKTVYADQSIKETMRIIDNSGLRMAAIVDRDGKFVGIAADGDIRRAILDGVDIQRPINTIMNTSPKTISENDLKNPQAVTAVIVFALKKDMPYIPFIDREGKFVDLVHYSKFEKNMQNPQDIKGLDASIVRRVLVVGGGGYLGSVLCRKLLVKGYKVRVLDIFMFGEEPIKELYTNKNFEVARGDIRNIETVSQALRDVDAVVHLAAMVGDPACKTMPLDTIETNYLASRAIAEACKYHQINRFIFASTCSVYGVGKEKLDEQSPLNPVSLYARSKIKSEEALLEMIDENFSPAIMRMGTLYGLSPRMRFDLVVNVLTKNAVTKKEIRIFGGEQYRPLLHVSDAAEAYIKCLEAPIQSIRGEVFNVGSDSQNYKIKDVGSLIKEMIPETNVVVSKDEADKRDYFVEFSKIRRVLGFETKKTVKDGILEIEKALRTNMIPDPENARYYNVED